MKWGTIEPIAEIANWRGQRDLFHTDAVQAGGYLIVDASPRWNVDNMSLGSQ